LLEELAKGGKKFHNFFLHKPLGFSPAALVWDGKYLAVNGSFRREAVIYRFDVSHKTAHVVQTVRPKNLSLSPWFAVFGDELVGTADRNGTAVQIWNYPAGGPPITTFSRRFNHVMGMALSLALQ
jgi:hypothetical protein